MAQNFSTGNVIQFHNNSTAGNNTTYTNTGSGSIQFWDTSSGGTASLGGTTTVTASAGTASFSLSVDKAFTGYTLATTSTLPSRRGIRTSPAPATP